MATDSVTIRSPIRWTRRIVAGSTIAIALFVLTSLIVVTAQISLGGLISEKLLGRTGTADSSLILGRSGTDETLHIMGLAPVVSTVPATNLVGEASATLRGTVSSMNGMPTATGYFQWGYSAGGLTNTTPTFTVDTTGNYSSTIGGFDNTQRIYYRFVTDADGTAYGAVTSFLVPSGVGGNLLKSILKIIVAAGIVIAVLKIGTGTNWPTAMVIAAIGLAGFAVICTLIDMI